MADGIANAALVEQYKFAALEANLTQGSYLIERVVENPLDFGILFVGDIKEDEAKCLQARVTQQKAAILPLLLQYIQPLRVG